MALYRYLALSETGKKITGVINAESLTAAKDQLRFDQMMVIDVGLFEEKKKQVKLPFSLLVDFTRMLGQLLRAGIPLYESLVIIKEKYRQPLFIDLCDALKSGLSFSESLAKYPGSFDPIYIAMVKAGEQTASLPNIFEELCSLLQRQQKLKRQLFSAAAYPLFLGSFCLVVFLALLLFVIPSMKTVFEGRALHPITHFIFSASDIVTTYGSWIFSTLFLLVTALFLTFRHPLFRCKIDAILLQLPFVGDFVREAATVRFCRTASFLLSGGIPILQTLQLSSSVMKNRLLEEYIEKAQQKVSEGKTLSGQLSNTSLIPSIVPRMLSIAEETGKTAFMLQSIANICEENLEKRLQQFVAVLQPALLLLLGLIVGIVLLSILIPLTDVGSMLT